MKEFMLLIKKEKDNEDIVTEEFLKATESYIRELKNGGKLISAQPIAEEDNIIISKNKSWKIVPLKDMTEGYYHLLAKDLDEAIEIAKANPEFYYHPNASIEVHPIKTMETSTGYTYPVDIVENLSFMDEMEVPF